MVLCPIDFGIQRSARGSPPGTGGVARSAGVVAHVKPSATDHPSCAASPPVPGGEPLTLKLLETQNGLTRKSTRPAGLPNPPYSLQRNRRARAEPILLYPVHSLRVWRCAQCANHSMLPNADHRCVRHTS